MQLDWLYPLKKRILWGVLGILTLSIAVTMVFLALFLRSRLIEDSSVKTRELGSAIKTIVSDLMITRNPVQIQGIMESVGGTDSSIVKAFILDRNGRIAYSSDKTDIGRTFNRNTEVTCQGCHMQTKDSPPDRTIMIESAGSRFQRNVMVLYNEPACYGCHDKSERINGKLIIDRSLDQTFALITSIEVIISGFGLVCLILLVPFLTTTFSRGIDRYINKIVYQNNELSILYQLMERLSMTIDLEELKPIVRDIIIETFGADEIDIILIKNNTEFSSFSWSRRMNKRNRRRIAEDDPLMKPVRHWMEGSLAGEIISGDGKELIIPVSKGRRPLVFIAARKVEPFAAERLDLVKAVSSHLAVAFENAFLHRTAITDELTGLYTQRHFRYCIDRQFQDFEKYGEKFSLLMLDIDNFKSINDTYGHPVGDTVLFELSGRISGSVRDNDLAFRYGGEEFAVILPGTDAPAGCHVAERIRTAIEGAAFAAEAGGLKVTISIGVATCPDNAISIGDLAQAADRALYKAKESGKNMAVMSGEGPKAS